MITAQILVSQSPYSGIISDGLLDKIDIPQTQWGLHTAGFFKKAGDGTLIQSEIQEWVADLAPEILRFPSGANSKFMHPFNATSGYGYDLCEMLAYYDVVDDDPYSTTLDCNCNDIVTWAENATAGANNGSINNKNEVNNFFERVQSLGCISNFNQFDAFRADILDQVEAEGRYLDQLIDLIEKIELENPGLSVQVVYCVNIISETADEVVNTLDFFQDNGVQVAGVELGNEVSNSFYMDLYDDGFSDYYTFLQGNSTGSSSAYDELIDVGGGVGVIKDGNHDYIQQIRQFDESIDIGIVAMPIEEIPYFSIHGNFNPNNFDEGPFVDWNSGISDALDDEISVTGIEDPVPTFDAMIIHPYFTPDAWDDYLMDYFEPDDLTPDGNIDISPFPFTDCYTFDTPDPILEDIFFNGREIFSNLFKDNGPATNYFQSLIYFYGYYFDFWSEDYGKKLWTTEWNLKDHATDSDPRNYLEIYNNTALQAFLIYNWFLKQMILDVTSYLPYDFYTITTFHNLLGESNDNLISIERDMLGDENSPYDIFTPNNKDYILRTPYAAFTLLKEIYKRNLQFIRSELVYDNPPTGEAFDFLDTYLFVVPEGEMDEEVDGNYLSLYVYFSNMFEEDQQVLLDEEYVLDLIGAYVPGDYGGTKSTSLIQFDQLYSTAGNNYYYSINECYDTEGEQEDIEFDVHASDYDYLDNVWYTPEEATTDFAYFTAPAYSMGYVHFVFTGNPPHREGNNETQIQVSPNPFNENVKFSIENITGEINAYFVLYDALGRRISEVEKITTNNFVIDRNQLPAGTYFYELNINENFNRGKLIIQ